MRPMKSPFKGPCTQIVYTLDPMYLYRDYFKANVYTIWVHGPLGVLHCLESGVYCRVLALAVACVGSCYTDA